MAESNTRAVTQHKWAREGTPLKDDAELEYLTDAGLEPTDLIGQVALSAYRAGRAQGRRDTDG